MQELSYASMCLLYRPYGYGQCFLFSVWFDIVATERTARAKSLCYCVLGVDVELALDVSFWVLAVDKREAPAKAAADKSFDVVDRVPTASAIAPSGLIAFVCAAISVIIIARNVYFIFIFFSLRLFL
jgi:hypothetical protein